MGGFGIGGLIFRELLPLAERRTKWEIVSTGTGKIIVVLFFSLPILLNVCKYLSFMALGFEASSLAACRRARVAFCSPAARMTLARACRAASASAAMTLWSCSGSRESFVQWHTCFPFIVQVNNSARDGRVRLSTRLEKIPRCSGFIEETAVSYDGY